MFLEERDQRSKGLESKVYLEKMRSEGGKAGAGGGGEGPEKVVGRRPVFTLPLVWLPQGLGRWRLHSPSAPDWSAPLALSFISSLLE